MKILLLMPNDGAANNYIINALQGMGHQVWWISHRGNPHAVTQITHLSNAVKFDYMIMGYFNEGYTLDLHFLRMLRMNQPQMKMMSVFFDVYIDGKFTWDNRHFIDMMKCMDASFFVTDSDVEKLRPLGVNAYRMFFGFDHTLLCQDRHWEKDIDISFIGQFGFQNNVAHTGRLEYLNAICEEFDKVEIYGQAGSLTNAIAKKYMGRPTYSDREYGRIVARSKISFGFSDFGEGVPLYSYPNRLVHTLGFGGFLIYNNIPLIHKDFKDGEHLVLYDGVDNCIDTIKKYLNDPAACSVIAGKGQKHVLENYTWQESLAFLFDIVDGKDVSWVKTY